MEIRSVTRNGSLTIAFIGNLLLVPLLIYLLYIRRAPRDPAMELWGTALLSAFPAVNFASYCIAKDGYFYPGLISRMSVSEYARAKVFFLRAYTSVFCVLLLPFVAHGTSFMLAAYGIAVLYYVGIGGMLILYASSRERDKISLRTAPFYATQGTSMLKIVLVLPVTTPLFFLDESEWWALSMTLALGITGMIFSDSVTNVIAKTLAKQKHKFLGF